MGDQGDDSRWDYDCPQFVDFTMPMPYNDGADQMFEHTVIGEGPSNAALHAMQVAAVLENEQKDMEVQEMDQEPEPHPSSGNKGKQLSEKAPKKVLSNVITNLEEWRKPSKHPSSGTDGGSPSKRPRKSAERALNEIRKTSATKEPSLKRAASVRMAKSSSVSSLPAESAPMTKTSSVADLRPTKNHTRGLSAGRIRSNSVGQRSTPEEAKQDRNTSASSHKSPKMKKMPKMDMLTGPSFLKRQMDHSSSSKAKSTEELELERIGQLKKELQHKRRLAQESYKKAMSKTAAYVVPHTTKSPTLPQEFHFETDTRLKSAADDKKVSEMSAGDFVKTLRSRTVQSPNPSRSAGFKTCTVPQPFHLTEKSKSSSTLHTLAGSKFESMAEKVSAFHKRTPDRFRARPRSLDRSKGERGRSNSPPGLTVAHTPNLQSRNRRRPVTAISQKEVEEKEIEEMKKNQFKAHPVNAKILTNPNTGVKKVASKPPTQPEEFQLSAAVRHNNSSKEEKQEEYQFHARPLNKKILDGPVGVKSAKPALPTVPMSPAFALKHRVRLPVEIPEDKPDPVTGVIKAKPVPHTGIPFQPKLPHQHTVPEPFTVETRSKVMMAQKEEKIKQALEEEKRAREFHAQPLPSHDLVLPAKMTKELTKQEPFQLETDVRGSRYTQELAHKLAEEEEEQRKAAEFHAQPNRIKDKKPFLPARSTKPLTEVSDFELNSDRRAVQREEFELRKKVREVELEGQRRQREQRQKEEEEAAIAKLRAEMVHRPNPVRRYAPVVVKPSDKPLTDAESPRFSERLRGKVRL